MKRITITIEESLYDKLPKYGKSGVINLLLKQHYQTESADKLYLALRQRLLQDQKINDYVANVAYDILNQRAGE